MPKPAWNLEENPKNKRWYVMIPEGLSEEHYPTIASIREKTSEKGIDVHTLLSESALEKSITKALSIPGEEFSFPAVIEPTFDVRLIIASDKTRASLYIRKASDNDRSMDMKLISTVINNSHLKGLDAQRIKDGIQAFKESAEMELPDFLLTEGKPSTRGKDRELITQVQWHGEEETAKLRTRLVQANILQPINPQDITHTAIVEKAQLLFEISPAETGEDGEDVYGKLIPGLPGNDPFIQTLASISMGPFGLRSDADGLLIASINAKGVKAAVIPYKDAKATAVISTDNMLASLILEKNVGPGIPLEIRLAEKALLDKGLTGTVNRKAIEEAITEVNTSGQSSEIVIIRGEKPVPSGGIRITIHAALNPQKNTAIVKAGDSILTLTSYPKGADGVDIHGTVLPLSQAIVEPLPTHDESIQEETSGNETIYRAVISGELTHHAQQWSISDTKEMVCDITEETGDITFPSNLTLTGTITSGRAVKAGGNLTVNGTAEASLVYAEKNVTMNGGINGSGRGTVWSKDNMSLTFAENARLLSGGDIHISKYCFQCTIKTNGTLIIQGNPALLMGGSIRATKGVETFELGSEKTIRTSISFGQNYLIGDQIEVCEREALKIKETVAKIDEMMKQTSNTNPKIHELRRKKLELLKRNDKLTVRIFTLKEQFETHVISHVRVENTVYPGVILESHGRYFEVKERLNHVIFIFDQKTGQITVNPIQDAPVASATQE